MPDTRLLRLLVPDLPAHRRTERDRAPSPKLLARKSAALIMARAAQPGLQRPSLISSCAGTIDRIMFAFPSYAVMDPKLAEGYRSVIGALRRGTRFVVVHNEGTREKIQSWFDGAGHAKDAVRFVPLPTYVSFTDWAEDGYVALRDAADDSRYLMEPWEFPRIGDALIADAVEEYADLRTAQAPLIFQGGNCLIGDDFWLMGKDYFSDSVNLVTGERSPVEVPANTTPESFVRKLFSDYVDRGRRLILVGTRKPIPLRDYYGTQEEGTFYLDVASDGAGTFQPIFHIDMLMTLFGRSPEGKYEALVGSPKMADQLLGTRSPFALDDVYDGIAADLEKQGVKVTRNPLVHWPTGGREWKLEALKAEAAKPGGEALQEAVEELAALGAKDSTPVKIRSWHHITWNNCLVEVSASQGKHVYMPTFGHGKFKALAAVDAEMRTLWEKQGFSVHPLADFNEFALRQGVVHCIKKYLERGQ